MDKLILLAPIISIVLLWARGFSFTFIYWWIPIMLLVPVYLEVDGPGIPPLTFYLFGFLPFVFRKEIYISAWKDRHWLDFFPYLFILTIVVAEFSTTGFKSARQLLFLNSLIFLGPYLAMKYIILNKHNGEVAVARVFVFILAAIATYNFYTFRFGFNHFLWIRDFWPDYTPNLRVVIPRWGFFRAQGPFVHPINAGIIFGFGLPMTFWLTKYNKIRPKLNGIFVIALITCGLFMTMSRGPFLGAFVSISLYLIGQSRHRVKIFVAVGVLILFFSVPLSFKVVEYLSLERIEASSSEHETILYRKDLIKNYIRVIKESPWVGYGFLNIPYVGDQKSIDNAYILYSLSWGIFNVLSVIGLCLASFLGLFKLAFTKGIDMIYRGIIWALMGGIAGCIFSMSTVSLARPASTILFLWAGWASAMMLRKSHGFYENPEADPAPKENRPSWSPYRKPKMTIL